MIDLTDSMPGKDENNFFVNCPYCIDRIDKADTKYHMGVSVDKGVYHCFRCDASGKLEKQTETQPTDVEFLQKLLGTLDPNAGKGHVVSIDYDSISMKISKAETPVAYKYLIDRGIDDRIISEFDIRCGKSVEIAGRVQRKWEGRILFPHYKDGQVVYIVARTYSNQTAKYLNTKTAKNSIVYGIDKVTDGKAILCEGIISALSAYKSTGIPAISCLGKYVLNDQADLIRSKVATLYFALDSDITADDFKKAYAILKKKRFDRIYFVPIPFRESWDNGVITKLCDPDDFKQIFPELLKRSVPIDMVDYMKTFYSREQLSITA